MKLDQPIEVPPKSTQPFDPSIAHTFQEWMDNGFSVWRGQKSTGKNESGLHTFTPVQVVHKATYLREQAINRLFNQVMRRNIRELQKDYP